MFKETLLGRRTRIVASGESIPKYMVYAQTVAAYLPAFLFYLVAIRRYGTLNSGDLAVVGSRFDWFLVEGKWEGLFR